MSQERRSSKRPQAAKVEEYDDDQDVVKAGTAVHAHKESRSSSRAPPPALERRQRHPEVAPDPARAAVAAAVRTVTRAAGAPSKKPVIHRHDSAQSKPTSSKVCLPNCDHPGCRAARNPERRYTLTKDQPSLPQHQHSYPQPQEQFPPQAYYPPQPPQQAYQYAQPPAPQQVPILAARPRRQSLLTENPRPASYHAGVPMAASYAHQHGPPPSPSAYQRSSASYYQPNPYYPPQPTGYLASTPPNQGIVGFPTQSPGIQRSPMFPNQSPVMQNPPTYPTMAPLLMSARAPINPDLPGYVTSTTPPRGMLIRRASARQPPSRPLPGGYLDEESSEDHSETGSEDEYSEDEHLVRSTRGLLLVEQEHDRRARRDRERMPPPTIARRPSTNKRHSTAPAVVPRVSYREPVRERLDRAPYSETDLELYPSDQFDSDRTARAVIAGRLGRANSTYSAHSRRPSLSTSATASSGQTPETSYSSGSGGRRIVEDRHGRQREYLSRDDRIRYDQMQKEMFRNRIEEDRARDRLSKQQDTAAMVEEYQRQAAAGVVANDYKELSAENINQAAARQLRRASGSHISHHSRKSSGSTKTGGVRISSGDTDIHLYGSVDVKVEAGEDGNGTRVIIGNSDNAYHGGSRGSKTGRSHGGSEVRTRPIQEEDGYEKGY